MTKCQIVAHSSTEKFDILSVVGGVPKYLEEIRPSLTADENIRRMCFLKQGLLFREFDETFSDVFGRHAQKRRAVLDVRTALVYDGRISPLIEAEKGFDILVPASRLLE